MRHLILVILCACAAAGCSGIGRLSAYSKDAELQQKIEEAQRKRYQSLKETVQTRQPLSFRDITAEFGPPVLTRNDYGKRTALYRDGSSFCAEKLYLSIDDQGNVSSSEVVAPCVKPQ